MFVGTYTMGLQNNKKNQKLIDCVKGTETKMA
jgi:hypothetical protein